MKDYLVEKGISVTEVTVVKNFHDAVCEACFICPNGDRFFVKLENGQDSLKLEDLDLLSLEETDCSNL